MFQKVVGPSEKMAPGSLGYTGVNYTTYLHYRDYQINHEIRIPSLNNQDSMESILAGFFDRGSR